MKQKPALAELRKNPNGTTDLLYRGWAAFTCNRDDMISEMSLHDMAGHINLHDNIIEFLEYLEPGENCNAETWKRAVKLFKLLGRNYETRNGFENE